MVGILLLDRGLTKILTRYTNKDKNEENEEKEEMVENRPSSNITNMTP